MNWTEGESTSAIAWAGAYSGDVVAWLQLLTERMPGPHIWQRMELYFILWVSILHIHRTQDAEIYI